MTQLEAEEIQAKCQAVVKDVRHLISMPSVCMKVLSMVNDERSTAKDFERVLLQDPPITAQILKMANSAFYGLRAKVDTVSRAVSVIGTKRISNLVLAVSAIKTFGKLTNGIISIENFWYHSIQTGLIASTLSKMVRKGADESIFVAGLLHDIGQLVLFHKEPEGVRQALTFMQEDPQDLEYYHYEREILGYDHTQVGAELARLWQLPSSLVECIKYHHEPELAEHHPMDVSIIHIASCLANLAELNSVELEDIPPISDHAWKVTGLSRDVVEAVISDAQDKYEETQAIFLAA